MTESTLHPIREELSQLNPDAMTFDGFDDALVGIATRFSALPLALYSFEKIIEVLLRDGGTYEEAVEYFDFNMAGAWVGEGTPVVGRFHFD
jgi:hypothetical protein